MKLIVLISLSFLLLGCSASQAPKAPVIEVTQDTTKIIEEPEATVIRPAFHTVKVGDTLTSIALNYGLSYRELAIWNNLKNPDVISVDQHLRLSAPANTPQATVVKKQKNPTISSTESSAATSATDSTASTTPTQPKTTLINTEPTTSDSAVIAPNLNSDIPIKSGPKAVKYAYSKDKLKQLKQQWQATPAATTQLATTTPTTSTTSTTPKTPITTRPAPNNQKKRFNVIWSWPTKNPVTQAFGASKKGITFAGATGDPVYSVADGKVIYVGTGVKAYGRLVIVKHNNDYISAYAHNDTILVKESDTIKRGSPIATFGSSGSAKVNLVLEIRKTGKPVDPLQVLPPTP